MAKPLLPGYVRLKNRAYQTPTGEVIGRREYDRRTGRFARTSARVGVPVASPESAQRAYAGIPPRLRIAGTGTNLRYWRVIDEYRWWQDHEGNPLTLRQAQADVKRLGIYRDLLSKDKSPNGPKAQALALLGRRRPGDRHRVGDTPVFRESPIVRAGYRSTDARGLF